MYVVCLDATETILRPNTKDNESRMAEESKGNQSSALRLILSLSCQLMIEQCTLLARFLSKAVSVSSCSAGLLASLRALGPSFLTALELIIK